MGKRLITQRRGKGSVHKTPSHRHKGAVGHPKVRTATKGVVVDIVHDPGHTAPIAVVRLESGERRHVLASEGVAVGQTIEVLAQSPEPGNVLTLRNVPEGTPVFNIETQPGDGGRLVRSAGTHAVVVTVDASKVVVRLPSGQFKTLNPACRATIGVVAGGGRKDKPFAKAGKVHHALRSKGKLFPRTSGVAKNPVDHPHGGGNKQHLGKPGTVSRHTPPGRKVGHIAAKRTGKR